MTRAKIAVHFEFLDQGGCCGYEYKQVFYVVTTPCTESALRRGLNLLRAEYPLATQIRPVKLLHST